MPMPSAALSNASDLTFRQGAGVLGLRAARTGLALAVLAAGPLHAQSPNLRPGCWDIRIEINTIINQAPQGEKAVDARKLPSVDELMQQTLARLTPQQRAHIDVAQLREEIARTLDASRKALEQAQAAARKPLVGRRVLNGVRCSANPLSDLRITAGDVKRSDPQHFEASHRQTAQAASATVTTVAKWISEATPHMPYSPAPTDLYGRKALGPHDVTWLDQNRIVAVIDGRRITALEAYLILNLPPRHILEPAVYQHGWTGVLQHNYMYWATAYELDPRKHLPPMDKAILGVFSPFNTGSDDDASVDTRVDNYHYVGTDRQEYDREQHLWGVYLSRAASQTAKEGLAQQAQDKYRVSVVDPDFFAGHPGP